jgi:opacity protein-like surface antigen
MYVCEESQAEPLLTAHIFFSVPSALVRRHATVMEESYGGEWMIGKVVKAGSLALVLTLLLGSHALAQQTPAQSPPAATPDATDQQPAAPAPAAQPPTAPTPAAQQPANGQEPAEEEPIPIRRTRPRDYKKWTFDAGVGANTNSGTTKTYVRGGGGLGTVGVARNADKYLGLRADFTFADLPLRASTLELAQATGASSYVLALTLDPIINFSVTKLWSGYVLLGPGFYHRGGGLQGDTEVPGSACNKFWIWWGACANVSIPLSGDFIHTNQNEFGYNLGAGVARKMPSGVEIYFEYRIEHGSADNSVNNVTTDFRPITLGVRW